MTTVAKSNAIITVQPSPAAAISSPNTAPAIDLGPKFKLLEPTNQIQELQTLIRDSATSRSHFKFVADRLIRTVIEEGLNQLPYSKVTVTTPTGCEYKGLEYMKGNCGVSIVRSGEAMEKALQVRGDTLLCFVIIFTLLCFFS